VRTIIDLTDDQIEWLAKVCARDGISRAEAIRRALTAERERDDKSNFEENMAAVFGMWKDRGIDSLEYERALREEWER
jgi:hypothetical protein